MVHVHLEREWTDEEGVTHSAGSTVDVDAGTLARLEAAGVVADPQWIGPTGDPRWIGPTGDPEWIGPTGDPT